MYNIIRNDVSPLSIRRLVEHQCYNSETGSEFWLTQVLDGCMNAIKPESLRPFLNVLVWIVNMTDVNVITTPTNTATSTTTTTTTQTTTQTTATTTQTPNSNNDITEYRAAIGVEVFMKIFSKFNKSPECTNRLIAVNDKLSNNNQKWKKYISKHKKTIATYVQQSRNE